MLQLNYYIHSILNSKYRIFIVLIIYLLFYKIFNQTSLVYCITNSNDLVPVAENKESAVTYLVEKKSDETSKMSNQSQQIYNSIKEYAGTQAKLLEDIKELQERNDLLIERNRALSVENENLDRRVYKTEETAYYESEDQKAVIREFTGSS